MNRKLIIIISAGVIIVILIIALIIISIPPSGIVLVGARKAIILCSANDFQKNEPEDDFNGGVDAKFNNETNHWVGNFTNGYGFVDNTIPGHDTPGVIILMASYLGGYVNIEFVYNWTKYYPLYEFAIYNFSVWIKITSNIYFPSKPITIIPPGFGARIGLRWLNSSNDVVRTDWSNGIFETKTGWTSLNVTGIVDSFTQNRINQLHLVLAVEGNMSATDMVLFDDLSVERWISVNVTNPINPIPPPGKMDSDGFPAQALQVYWILRNHGYSDDNIFLILYHKNDDIIDIKANDNISNDLTGAIIDVEDDYVNASRFKQELNCSIDGSFASSIRSKDQLIIYMVDHGSNKIVGDNNASYHFEADNSYITEIEFYNLVKQINCESMMINIDSCFSGNFLSINSNIGQSWYNISKSIFITSSTDKFSWYWKDNSNLDGFAGSWFFHIFWDQLNQNRTIKESFEYAIDYIPAGQTISISQIQNPQIHDNLGIIAIWSFESIPPL